MAEADAGRPAARPDGVSRWLARTTVLRKRQRAFGDGPALPWLADRHAVPGGCPPEAGAAAGPLAAVRRMPQPSPWQRPWRPLRPARAMPTCARQVSRVRFQVPVWAQARAVGESRPAAACDRQRLCSTILRSRLAPSGPAPCRTDSRVSRTPSDSLRVGRTRVCPGLFVPMFHYPAKPPRAVRPGPARRIRVCPGLPFT